MMIFARLRRRAWICIAVLMLASCARSRDPNDSGHVWYVSAAVNSDGNGTHAHPFNALRSAQDVSVAGDTIVVLAAPLDVSPLDGGIVLKAGQRLIGQGESASAAPRLTNSSNSNAGDAVTLAPDAEVSGLKIINTMRGGIHGLNVSGVNIHDNEVSGHNTSCAQGIIIPPDNLPTTTPGVTFPNPLPLPNGWAGIYVLADQGSGKVTIRNNVVHDSPCGDGIDIGLSGTAVYSVVIDGNTTYMLTQSGNPAAGILSVLAIGMQTKNTSRMTATVSNNIQHDLGTANASNVDPECVYPNVVDASTIIANISHNNCYNSIGGWSANGLEIPMMNDGGTAIINVSHSQFTDVTSDIIEPIALGTNQYLEVNLDHVIASRANGQGASPLIDIAGQFSYGNEGDCVSMFTASAGNALKLKITDSTLSDCYFNGLSIATNNVIGSAPTKLVSFEIDNSTITASHGNGIRFFNGSGLSQLAGKVQNSNISGNATTPNLTAPRYNINISNQGSATPEVILDFGGGQLGSAGGNCIVGAGVLNNGYTVSMQNNWWGSAGGPPAGAINGSGTTETSSYLSAAPSHCQ